MAKITISVARYRIRSLIASPTLALVLASLALSAQVSAQEIECNSQQDASVTAICQLAKKLSVSPIKLAAAQFVANIEATSKHCSYDLSKDFFAMKSKMRSDAEINRVYDLLLRASLSSPPKNLGVFCPTAYNMAGPNSSGTRLFK